MIGERLKRARAASGLTMAALGKGAGVSANMIKKYEHNESMPSSSVLIGLSRALSVRAEYFFRPNTVTLQHVEFRKKASATKKAMDKITRDILDQAERWHELINLWPEFPIKPFKRPVDIPVIQGYEQLEDLATEVRNAWNLGMNPIPSLIDLLELHGILVIETDADDGNVFDGLQATVEGQPVIVVSSQGPGDRQRFTLCHELGHLLLQDRLSQELDEEQACNRFASAFLLPASEIRMFLGDSRRGIEVRELWHLKHEFGLSMQGCIYRALNTGIIDDRSFLTLQKLFSRNRWKKVEPGEQLEKETTNLFEQLVYRGLGEGILSESKAAQLLQIPLIHFRKERMFGDIDAVAH